MKNRFLTSRDYAKLCERARRMLDREIEKPSAEWDEDLIAELEETMLYCAERREALEAEKTQRAGSAPSFRLKRALIVAAAVIAVLLLSMTVAEVAGLKVWSAIIHWNKDYLSIDYSLNQYENPPSGSNTDNTAPSEGDEPKERDDPIELDFDSFDELAEYIGDRLVLPYDVEGLQLVSAKVKDDGHIATVDSAYLLDGSEVRLIEIWCSTEQGYFSANMVSYNDYDNVWKKDINGVECVFAENEDCLLCTFVLSSSYCYLTGNIGEEAAETIINAMLSNSLTD